MLALQNVPNDELIIDVNERVLRVCAEDANNDWQVLAAMRLVAACLGNFDSDPFVDLISRKQRDEQMALPSDPVVMSALTSEFAAVQARVALEAVLALPDELTGNQDEWQQWRELQVCHFLVVLVFDTKHFSSHTPKKSINS